MKLKISVPKLNILVLDNEWMEKQIHILQIGKITVFILHYPMDRPEHGLFAHIWQKLALGR